MQATKGLKVEKISWYFMEHVRAEQGVWISVCDVSGENRWWRCLVHVPYSKESVDFYEPGVQSILDITSPIW